MSRIRSRLPEGASSVLLRIPADFRDDGCSRSPDSLFGFDFRWACRIHDWRYCTRSHPPGSMTYAAKLVADWELRENVRKALPWRWRWVGWVYRAAVHVFGSYGAFDSCGPEAGERCRHNLELHF